MVTVARSLTNQLRAFQHPTSTSSSLQALPLNTTSPFHSLDLRLIRVTNLLLGVSSHILRFADLAAREDCLGLDLVGLGAGLVGDLLRLPGVLLGSFGVLGGAFELLVHVRFVLLRGYMQGVADGEAAQFSVMWRQYRDKSECIWNDARLGCTSTYTRNSTRLTKDRWSTVGLSKQLHP